MPLPALLALNAVLAFAGRRLGAVSRSGAAAGLVVGAAVAVGLGWPGYLLLCLGFVLGAASTRVGWERKAARGVAEASGGARGARQVFANAGPPALFALAAGGLSSGLGEELWGGIAAAGFAGALATLAADTVASEIGQCSRGRTMRLTDFARVPPGTSGAVTVLGSLAGLAASFAVASAAAALFLPPRLLLPVAAAGFAAAFFEGLLQPLEARGFLKNDGVNAVSVLTGGSLASGAGWFLTGGAG